MINANNLLEQFLGAGAAGQVNQAGSAAKQELNKAGLGGFGGGAIAGGLLGLMLGNKKMRKMGGGMMSYGGAAAAGALALKAYQNWQQGQHVGTAPVVTQADLGSVEPRFIPGANSAANGQAFPLVLIQAMIAAAKADGHIDAQEQKAIFEQVDKLGLDAQSKGFVFDALIKPVDLSALAASVQGIEQASEVYLVSRMAIDPEHPAELAYLDALAHRLNLPPELAAHLDHQVAAASVGAER